MRPTARQSTLAAAVLLGTGMLAAPAATAAPTPRTGEDGTITAPSRTQISFENSLTGYHAGTANEHESRAGLSVVKMYIADYVFAHGDPADHAAATQMLQFSDDATASSLYAKYPESISTTAAAYGLTDTHDPGYWGDATTSTADSVRYLEAKKREDPGSPVLSAMATASPVAADGYSQDFGTAVLPGVIGTKWGWSDDGTSFTASASYGTDFSVAAATDGPPAQLTADVQDAFTAETPAAPAVPGLPSLPLLPEMPPLPALPFP